MRSLGTRFDADLAWVRPNMWCRRLELRAGDETVATLDWPRRFRSIALATTADGEWTFERAGFWPAHVSVRFAGAETEDARFEASRTGTGILHLEGGSTVAWKAGNFWRTRWGWHDAAGSLLIGFRRRTVGLQVEGAVEVEVDAPTPARLALLVCLGWYLVVLSGNPGGGVSAGPAKSSANA